MIKKLAGEEGGLFWSILGPLNAITSVLIREAEEDLKHTQRM